MQSYSLQLSTYYYIDSHAKTVWFVLKIKFNQNLYGFFFVFYNEYRDIPFRHSSNRNNAE